VGVDEAALRLGQGRSEIQVALQAHVVLPEAARSRGTRDATPGRRRRATARAALRFALGRGPAAR
jgi:hypothetical protein